MKWSPSAQQPRPEKSDILYVRLLLTETTPVSHHCLYVLETLELSQMLPRQKVYSLD